MAASVTATSVLPAPPKPEPTVITPDFTDRSRIPDILWRRHSAVASRLARSRLPRLNTTPRIKAPLGTPPLAPSGAGAPPPAEGGDDAAQAALSLPGNSIHPSSSGNSDITPSQVRVSV